MVFNFFLDIISPRIRQQPTKLQLAEQALVKTLNLEGIDLTPISDSELAHAIVADEDVLNETSSILLSLGYGTPISAPKIAELETYEEFLNEESILIDKSRTSSTSIESFEFSKEWSKKFNLEYERVSTNHSGSDLASSLESSIGFEATIKSEMKSGITSTIKSSVEETIKQKYCITEGVLYKRVEKTQISIPAYTKTRLIICWKNIWQKGIIEISDPSSKVQIPFKVLVSVTFDRKQIDL